LGVLFLARPVYCHVEAAERLSDRKQWRLCVRNAFKHLFAGSADNSSTVLNITARMVATSCCNCISHWLYIGKTSIFDPFRLRDSLIDFVENQIQELRPGYDPAYQSWVRYDDMGCLGEYPKWRSFCVFWVFLPRSAMHKRGLCRRAVSVRPSITFVYCVETSNHIRKLFSTSSFYTPNVMAILRRGPLKGASGNAGPCRGYEKSWFRPISCVIWDLRNDTRYDLSYNGVLRDLSNGVIFNLLLVCVSFTIIGQPWNSVLIRRV